MSRISSDRLVLLAPLLLALCLHAEVRAFKNFTLIDGTGRAPVASAAMVIDNGRIQWVGPASQLKVPAGAQTVDLGGKFVMPGIINLHGHLGNIVGMTEDAKNFTRANLEKDLHTYASYGVTTVLSLGTDKDLILKVRYEQRAGRPVMTRVYTAGQGLILKGGFGGTDGINEGVATVPEVAPAVHAQAMKHVDFIKFWLDDGLGSTKKMPLPIAKAVIDAAHKEHLRAAAHIFYLEDARQITDYGVDALAHCVRDKPIDPALIDSMKKHGTWQIAATLTREASKFIYATTPEFASDPFFTRGVSPDVLKTIKSSDFQKSMKDDPNFGRYPGYLETAKKNFKKLVDAGVKYGFGTDTGNPGRFPGYFEHWEMSLLVEAGLTPMQVLTAATRNGAEFLGAKDLGTLEVSKWADLVILDRNPIENIKNTRSISAVYIAGHPVGGK
jgi:imidazolonepropionase-like amidohydrolase